MRDWARLFAWRNDPLTRENSLSTVEVTLEDHMRWLTETLKRDDVRLFVATHPDSGVTVGTGRLNLKPDGVVELSLTVDPHQRGAGYAGQIIAGLVAHAPAGTTRLRAEVRLANGASLRAFAGHGFLPVGSHPDGVAVLEREGGQAGS